MPINILIDRIEENSSREAIIWKDQIYSYGWLLDRIRYWDEEIKKKYALSPGTVIQLQGDYSPNTCSLLISLIRNRNIIVPLTSVDEEFKKDYQSIAEVQRVLTVDSNDTVTYQEFDRAVSHEILNRLAADNDAGLILFSSGVSGKPKAIVHSFNRLLRKFLHAKKSLRTLTFLLFDHIAGIDTLFYSLFSGGTLVFPQERTPSYVCGLIEKHKIEVLPTSPTYLNLLLMSEEYKSYDLSSLRIITYGSEPMPSTVLKRINDSFPDCRIIQKYGISELGSPRSKSKDSSSLWVKIDSENFKTKVVDGVLWVKADSAMLGYLNAPSPFDEDGWFNTEDRVEVDGEYITILGRESDIINVGGQKVYPAEVESVLLELDGITDVTVIGETNPILGQIVKARISLAEEENMNELKKRVRRFCTGRLAEYKIPQRIEIAREPQFHSRFKRIRR